MKTRNWDRGGNKLKVLIFFPFSLLCCLCLPLSVYVEWEKVEEENNERLKGRDMENICEIVQELEIIIFMIVSG